MIYKMTLKDSADEMTFDLLEVPIVDKDIEGAVDNVTLDGNQYTDYLWLKKQFVQKWSILCDDEYTRLRGFYTRQFENADVPSYRLYYGDDIIRNSTLSGERIELSISGVADGTISLTQMDGNTIQDDTPAPSAPVPIETVTGRQTVEVRGKNLLKLFTGSHTEQGLTATANADGSFTYTGAPTTTWANLSPTISNTIPAGTYTFSRQTGNYYSLRFIHADGTNTQINLSTNASGVVTLQKDAVSYRFWVYNLTAGTQYNVTERLQLEQGTSASSFEPFNGQAHEINLGKNLIEPRMPTTTYNGVTCTNNGDGSFTLNGTATATATWRIEQSTGGGHDNLKPLNGTYTLSCGGLQNGMRLVVTQFNVWQTVGAMNDNDTPATFTTSLNDLIIYVAVMNGTTVNNVTIYPQLERGSTASSYSAYFEPIELCKIGTYQDRIFKENGKWFLHKEIGEVVFDGSENWSLVNAGASNFYYNLPVFVTPKDQDIMPVSNYFVGTPITNGNTSVGLWITNAGTIRARKETEQTLANYKTWLSTALPSVYYVLATPTDTEITNEALLEELEALQDEAISVGQHNIYTDTPNALPTLTFDLTEYLSRSTTIIPETAVRLTLTDGGVINACGCRKDVQLTMRETIE